MSPIVQTGMSATDVLPSKIRRLTAGTCLVWHTELNSTPQGSIRTRQRENGGRGVRTQNWFGAGFPLLSLCSQVSLGFQHCILPSTQFNPE